MKRTSIILLGFYFFIFIGNAQEIPSSAEQQLENLTDAEQMETEDDSYLQQLEHFRKNPLNLNVADKNDLKELGIITDLQIDNLISYRHLFGKFFSIYELQAIPTWDMGTIRKLLPFITIHSAVSKSELMNRFKHGSQSLLFRFSQQLEKSKGYDKTIPGTKYMGGPQRLFFRYRYTYKNLLQVGFVADKDAGESFFSEQQKRGFDFYSFHLFIKKIGIIDQLAVGDFTVNMGQGLIQWQTLAFKKSADITGIKRQSPVLKPYSSAGEYNFNRGIGITLRKRNLEITAFGSVRRLSANLVMDTSGFATHVSSFQLSGNHRTESEIADRNSLQQTSVGSVVKYTGKQWHIALNAIHYTFSLPIKKEDEAYHLFSIDGRAWYNLSVDYSYTYKNFHFFGEAAADKNRSRAFVNGLLVSFDPNVDVSLVHRSIAASYQALNANAFTENTYPSNEKGLYAGIAIRPEPGWRIDLYGDMYQFPWLKSRVDAPSYGRDFLAQVSYVPNKQVEIYTRFRNGSKQANQTDNNSVTNSLVPVSRKNWRVQVNYKLSPAATLRHRVELLWLNENRDDAEKGFLTFFDFLYTPVLKRYSAVARLQYFETDTYNSRLYAYENDVLYGYSIPAFYDKGYRYYIIWNHDLTKKLSVWVKWSQTIYRSRASIGSGLDEITGKRKSEIKIQARLIL